MLGGDKFWIHVQGFRELFYGSIVIPRKVQLPPQAGVGEQRKRIEILGFLQFCPGFIESPHTG